MRRLLLDSHVLLWWLFDDPALGPETRKLIGDRNNYVGVSAASVWEIAIKAARGKLVAPDGLPQAVRDSGFLALAVTFEHAERAAVLPRHHGDPFDRMLVAQVQIEHLELLTRDRKLHDYDVRIVTV